MVFYITADRWLVTALQTHVDVWEIAKQYAATIAEPNNSVPGQADSEVRRQARWVGGVVWLGDLAGALAVARRAALLGFSGPQVREERRWLSLARWAAQHSGAGLRGYVGARPPQDRGQVGTPAHGGGGGSTRTGCDTAYREAPAPRHVLWGEEGGALPMARSPPGCAGATSRRSQLMYCRDSAAV